MAAMACEDVMFASISRDAFYFQVADDEASEIENDCSVSEKGTVRWIKSKDNYFLLVQDDKLVCETLTNSRLTESALDCKFRISNCKVKVPKQDYGRGVMMYVIAEDCKFKLVCCNDQGVYVDSQDSLPKLGTNIISHEALFYLKNVQGNIHKMVPSVHPNTLLGFVPDDKDPSRFKLTMRTCQENEADEHCHICLEHPK